MLVLLGILVVVVGFALRLNPMLVVTVAGLVTGFLGGMTLVEVLNAFGTGFAGSRSVSIFLLVLPVIGLVEHFGLQQQARRLVSRLARLSTGGILAGYLLVRQVTAAIGLMSIGGHAQTVRPLVAPMAEAAAVRKYGPLPDAVVAAHPRLRGQHRQRRRLLRRGHLRGGRRGAADHLVRRHHVRLHARPRCRSRSGRSRPRSSRC